MANIETRRAADGTISFRAKVRLKGYPQDSQTFRRITDAKLWVKRTEAAMLEGRHFKTAEAKRHTLGDLVDRYVREVLPTKPKNASNCSQHLAWWKAKLGTVALSDIQSATIVRYRNELLATTTRRKKKMANATVVRYMASLSHAFNIAVKEWQWMDDSPLRKVSKPREPRGRERYLSPEERTALLAACEASSSRFLHTVC